MSRLANPWFAILFGAFILCAETCRHVDVILALPARWFSLPFDDWIAGLLLVLAGSLSRYGWRSGSQLQVVAWSFMLSLLVSALFNHLEDWNSQAQPTAAIPEGVFLVILLALVTVALCALVQTIKAERPDDKNLA